jgi:hypothetical protein
MMSSVYFGFFCFTRFLLRSDRTRLESGVALVRAFHHEGLSALPGINAIAGFARTPAVTLSAA